MIIVTVELRSAISRSRDKVLGRLTIANDGTGDASRGHYAATLEGRGGRVIGSCVIKDFPRKRLPAATRPSPICGIFWSAA